MLEVHNLSAWYGPTQALFKVSLQVPEGTTVALVGINGSGKTTLVRSILGLVRSEGRITMDGVDLSLLSTHRRVGHHGVSVVPEGRGMLSGLSVEENLELGRGRLTSADKEFIEQSFAQIIPRLRERVSNLSGGEQQMIALCRAFLRKPKLLIMDEPSLGLAPIIVDAVYERIAEIQKEGATVLLVEQDVERARRASDSMCFVSAGVVMGTADSTNLNEVERMVSRTFVDVGGQIET